MLEDTLVKNWYTPFIGLNYEEIESRCNIDPEQVPEAIDRALSAGYLEEVVTGKFALTVAGLTKFHALTIEARQLKDSDRWAIYRYNSYGSASVWRRVDSWSFADQAAALRFIARHYD